MEVEADVKVGRGPRVTPRQVLFARVLTEANKDVLLAFLATMHGLLSTRLGFL